LIELEEEEEEEEEVEEWSNTRLRICLLSWRSDNSPEVVKSKPWWLFA